MWGASLAALLYYLRITPVSTDIYQYTQHLHMWEPSLAATLYNPRITLDSRHLYPTLTHVRTIIGGYTLLSADYAGLYRSILNTYTREDHHLRLQFNIHRLHLYLQIYTQHLHKWRASLAASLYYQRITLVSSAMSRFEGFSGALNLRYVL